MSNIFTTINTTDQTNFKSNELLKKVLKNKIKKLDTFSLCTPRKDMMINRSNSKVISYIEPDDYNKNHRKNLKSIDFNKMKKRNFDGFIKSNVVPAVCTYSPNYDSIYSTKNQCKIICIC